LSLLRAQEELLKLKKMDSLFIPKPEQEIFQMKRL
jgi:hypothetical protein